MRMDISPFAKANGNYVTKAVNVPLTWQAKAHFMIQNVLPAALTGYTRI